MAVRCLGAALLLTACPSRDPTFNADEGSGDSVPGGEVEVGGGDAFGETEGDATESTTAVSTTGDDDDDDDDVTDSGEESEGDDTTTGEPPPPMPSPACGGETLSPGQYFDQAFNGGEDQRRYDLHVPKLHDGITPLPLVLDLHELMDDEDDQRNLSDMTTAAEQEGFVALHPRGSSNSWNAGNCCGNAQDDNVDDVTFIRDLVEALGMELCIDERQVFATGFGNGASMVYRLACEASDVIAAVAPVGGSMAVQAASCTPPREVPVMHFHGTNDFFAPYNGGGPFGATSVSETMEAWQEIDGCVGESIVTFDVDDTVCERWSNCAGGSEVALCTIEEMGHCWPGNRNCNNGQPSTTLVATSAMLEFFASHPMP